MSSILQVQQQMLGQLSQLQSQAAQSPIRPAMHVQDVPAVSTVFAEAIKAVDAQQHQASKQVAAVELGHSSDLVGAMVQSQKASVAFSALLQVRNKLTTAFDDIMRTPL